MSDDCVARARALLATLEAALLPPPPATWGDSEAMARPIAINEIPPVLAELADEVERLRAALDRYGEHDGECADGIEADRLRGDMEQCSCGLRLARTGRH
jgi:hypothetical protein